MEVLAFGQTLRDGCSRNNYRHLRLANSKPVRL